MASVESHRQYLVEGVAKAEGTALRVLGFAPASTLP